MKKLIYPFIVLIAVSVSMSSFALDDNSGDSRPMCNFGGWMSLFDKEGNCMPPWKRFVKEDDGIADFGQPYTSKFSCGKNLFRCNPLVFGPANDGKGHCVLTNDKDANLATKACLEKSNPKAIQEQIVRLSKDPEKHAQFIGVAAETIRFCKSQTGGAEYCNELESILSSSSKRLADCTKGSDLYDFLPFVVSPLNEDEINQITNNLVPGFEKYLIEKQRKIDEAKAHNKLIYDKALATFVGAPKTALMIKTIKGNTTKCLDRSCYRDQKDKTSKSIKGNAYWKKNAKGKNRLVKKAHGSLAFCYRYVKYGLTGKDNYVDSKWDIGGVNAVHAGKYLKDLGFQNIMNDPNFPDVDIHNAPIGSIIVYKKKGAAKGRPGHIEIKTAEDEYTSDFINDSPTTVGGQRIPIGIYVDLPKDQLSKLVEVPNE